VFQAIAGGFTLAAYPLPCSSLGTSAISSARSGESMERRDSDALQQDQQSSAAELPVTVRDAALFLGVSQQTVYLWVERKQIPHLRVMGRNIRFLQSDLEPFRTGFKQEVENGKTP
jgi:excisionase family DNA binding protein